MAFAQNQTEDLSPIYPAGEHLPFDVKIELADFTIPQGIHSCVSTQYQGKWLLLAGRTNGLHGFGSDPFNFPPTKQNQMIYVVDPCSKMVWSRALDDPASGFTEEQIDSLSVTSPQFYRSNSTLYITGGYGANTLPATFSTKPVLTAIDIPRLMQWVMQKEKGGETASLSVRQIFDPIFQVTGGVMAQIGQGPTLLIFGQNFDGFYLPSSNGAYSEQIRRFYIHDDGVNLSFTPRPSKPALSNSNFRRRDLNVVPIIREVQGRSLPSLVAFAGVFTPSVGVWTVPVEITAQGTPFMADPSASYTFKQGMNHYVCPTLGLFSKKTGNMYTVLFGGISYGYFSDGQFLTDPEIPFINQVTTIKIDRRGRYKQYLMNHEYPEISSTFSNPGNQLLFGAGAVFMHSCESLAHEYKNGVLKLNEIKKPFITGYIVGGIQSTLPNTNTQEDSAASPWVFQVKLIPRQHHAQVVRHGF